MPSPGEADWKIIAIDVQDRWASELNDVDDVERLLPGTISAVREWCARHASALAGKATKAGRAV